MFYILRFLWVLNSELFIEKHCWNDIFGKIVGSVMLNAPSSFIPAPSWVQSKALFVTPKLLIMPLGYLRTEQVLSQMILRKKYETLVTQRGGEILFLKNEYFH